MKYLVSLEKVEGNTLFINDFKKNQSFEISKPDSEICTFKELLDTSDSYEAPDEETGVYVIYDDIEKDITFTDNESELI